MNALGARGRPLAAMLLTAEGLVILAMSVTMVAVASTVGPPVFHEHMQQAGHAEASPVVQHAELAFRSAGMITLAVGITIAALGAFVVNLLITRRLGRSLTVAARAAEQLSRGRYDARLHDPGVGAELATLAGAFNDMAARLESTELTRRRLLTDLAHEMRTPLAAIDICLEGLEDGVLPADHSTYRTLRQQTSRLTRLTDDIRAVSAADEGRVVLEAAPTAVADLIEQAVMEAREAYQRQGVALTHASVADNVVVTVDAARIGQVLANLLSNALRHTPAGGAVRLDASADEAAVEITVVDNGDGIPPETLHHVFERFYRVDTARDRDHGGTGVGLTISAGLARAHGGALTAASEGIGQGAAFTLRLPRA